MFTGIITAIGLISEIDSLGNNNAGVRIKVSVNEFSLSDVSIGDSIAVNGACLTVTAIMSKAFCVDVSRETLNCTTGLNTLGPVNLEKSLTFGERLSGHLVSGHIDDIGVIEFFSQVEESWSMKIAISKKLGKYLAYKGSITVNGVSLTINSVKDNIESCMVSINLIPHTILMTNLKNLKKGHEVNLEVDLIARYVERMLSLSETKQVL